MHQWLVNQRMVGVAVAAIVVLVSQSAEAQVPARPASTVTNPAPKVDTTQLDAALNLTRQSLTHMQQNVENYKALFVKRCRIDGELPPPTFANIKVRNRRTKDGRVTTPFSVYLNFLKPENVQGREVIWVEGENNGKLVAHETGVGSLINVYLDPRGMIAMRGQRYPITDIGLENLAAKIIERGMEDRPHGECEVKFFRGAKVGETSCLMCQVTHPVKRPHFDFYQVRVYFDEKQKVPVRYESWSWPTSPGGKPVLEEEYTYLNLELNAGLTSADFSIENPDYRFR